MSEYKTHVVGDFTKYSSARLIDKAFQCALLLVEDNIADVSMFNRICDMSSDEFKVEWVSTGEAALSLLSQKPHDYDLVVSDIGLPGMSGLELFEIIHQDYPWLSLIVLTGIESENDIIDALHIGVNNYCKKGRGKRYQKLLPHTIKQTVIRRRKHDALIKAELSLAVQVRKVDLADRAKVQFMRNISHELRTPLNCVVGFAEALLSGVCGELDEKIESYIEGIHDSGKNLHRLVEEILSITDIESGNIMVAPEPVSVEAIVNSAVDMVKNAALSKGQSIKICRGKNGVGVVPNSYLDSRHLRQILMNLLNNAISYCHKGAEIQLTLEMIDRGNRESLEIILVDNGPGISEIDHEDLFEPFTRPQDSFLSSVGGVGIGLSIVKALCDENNILLDFCSKKGKGTTVCLLLPPFIKEDWQLDLKFGK